MRSTQTHGEPRDLSSDLRGPSPSPTRGTGSVRADVRGAPGESSRRSRCLFRELRAKGLVLYGARRTIVTSIFRIRPRFQRLSDRHGLKGNPEGDTPSVLLYVFPQPELYPQLWAASVFGDETTCHCREVGRPVVEPDADRRGWDVRTDEEQRARRPARGASMPKTSGNLRSVHALRPGRRTALHRTYIGRSCLPGPRN